MIVWLLLLVLVIWIVSFRIKRRRMYQLASLIPKLKEDLPLIGVLHLFVGNSEERMHRLIKIMYESMQFNGIVHGWLGHKLYFALTNPVDLEVVLKTCLEKDDVHRVLRTVLGNGILFAPVDVWRVRRKIMLPVFKPKILENSIEIISAQSEGLAKALDPKANGEPFILWPFLISYTLDSVCETSAGIKMNLLNNENSEFLKAAKMVIKLMTERLFCPWLQPNWLYKLFPQYQEICKHMNIVTSFADPVINKRRLKVSIENKRRNETDHFNDVGDCRTPYLDLLILSSGGDNGYSTVDLREEILSLIAAAMDTSSITIGNVMKLLAKYPEVQEKLYEELHQVFGDSDRLLEKDDLNNLKYMERVVKETLRLFPPAPIIVRKVEEELTLPSGRVLPAGSDVVCGILGAHRDPKYWGPTAEHFDPDRFLPERFNLAHACSFMPFSYGPRNCIEQEVSNNVPGYQYGMVTVKIVLAAILRRFRVVGDEETGPVPSLRFKMEVTMKAVDEYRIALQKRNSVPI